MASFLFIMADRPFSGKGSLLFGKGLEIARRLFGQEPLSRLEENGAWAATFKRRNGSGSSIALERHSGNWLLTSGTWFHKSGLGPGHEPKLLDRLNHAGVDSLSGEMEGFFVLVSGNYETGEANVLTDIIGSCHCFLRTWPGISAVSDSSLLLASLEASSLDPIACQEFLHTGVIYEDRSIFREARKLGAASSFHFQNGQLQSSRRYWHAAEVTPNSLTGRTAVEEVADTLAAAARRIGAIFPRIVCDLTGGYDSRALVAGMLQGKQRFSTVVSGPESSPDSRISASLAAKMKLPHIHLNGRPTESFAGLRKALELTDGECDLVEYSKVLEIHSELSKHFDISLNGSFGEVGRGYWWELLIPRTGAIKPLDSEKLARLRYAAGNHRSDLFSADVRIDIVTHMKGVIERTNSGLSGMPNTLQMDNLYLSMRMQRWQGRIASSTNRIWPCLSPFMFRSVLEAMLRADFRIRKRSLLARRLLAYLDSDLASHPLEHGYPAIPFTLRSGLRFWPVLPLYGRKVVRKLSSRVGIRTPQAEKGTVGSPRLCLWRDEEVIKLLEPKDMALASLLNPAVLGQFLAASRQADFPYDSQWSRLLSLELAVRTVRNVEDMH